MDETKVQIGEDVILDIGIHSDWYISAVSYDGKSVNADLRRKADRHKEWWSADTPQTTLCRECDDYAGDGMYCASNYLVRDFSTSAENCETESTGSPIGDYRDGVGAWSDCPQK